MGAYWPEFLKLAIAHLLAASAPGPDLAIVLRQSLTFGRRAGVLTALGIGCAISIHVGYTLFGLGLLLHRSPIVFDGIKYAGAAYLAWLGIKALRARPAAEEATSGVPRQQGESATWTSPPRSDTPAWRVGFMTNVLNPKVALFFVAFFATLVSPHTPAGVRVFYGAWICLATIGWFSFVAFVFTHAPIRRAFLRYGHWIDRAFGVVFILFALLLAIASV